MKRKIHTVIFDWAGTVIDYGSFAPIQALLQAFEEKNIEITLEEVRKPMGMHKRDHIKEILNMDRVQAIWQDKYSQTANEKDIDTIFEFFENNLFAYLDEYTDPIPGVLDLVDELRNRGIKIGSTTGYTSEMMDIVKKHAATKGYYPDYLVAADEVKKARPYPYMIYKNLLALESFPPNQVIKVGDTVSDILEGKNAGVWSVGVIKGGSQLGLTEQEVNKLTDEQYENFAKEVTKQFKDAGADFVIDSIKELPTVIDKIEEIL